MAYDIVPMKGGFMFSTLDKFAIGLCLGSYLCLQIYIAVQLRKVVRCLDLLRERLTRNEIE